MLVQLSILRLVKGAFSRRFRPFCGLILCMLALAGCQSTSSSRGPGSGQTAGATTGIEQTTPVAQLRSEFMAAENLTQQLDRLTELEAQAMQLVDDEPLKLGSLGTAILDQYTAR